MPTKTAVQLTKGRKKAIVNLQALGGKIVADGDGRIPAADQTRILGMNAGSIQRMEKDGIIERTMHGRRTLAIVLKAPYDTIEFDDVKVPARRGRPPKDPNATPATPALKTKRKKRKLDLMVPAIGDELICTGVLLRADGTTVLVVASDDRTYTTSIEAVAVEVAAG